MKKFLLFCLLVAGGISSGKLMAQDPQFSQFYAAPLYLNPSFAGTGAEHRFIANHRIQWPNLPQAFSTYAFSYDVDMANINSGIGFIAMTDLAGSADLRSTTVAAMYNYVIRIGDNLIVRPSVYFGAGFRSLDFNKLLFGDQLDFNRIVPTQSPVMGRLSNTSFFDFASGILIYNKTFWAGVSSYHMNQPNTSMIDDFHVLPMKISAHAGVRIPLQGQGPFRADKAASIAPSVMYRVQGPFDQLDFGFHFHYDPIMAGFWYRGMAVTSDVIGNMDRDALVFMFGLRFDQFDVGYSYDIGVSSLGPNSGGAHEVSLMFQFEVENAKKKKRKEKFIPCPTF